MNIQTAEEFVRQFRKTNPIAQAESIEHWMGQHCIEFAKMHVKAALKQADEKATVTVVDYEYELEPPTPIWGVSSSSILNAYPLNNIK